jgi:hypothetical protein
MSPRWLRNSAVCAALATLASTGCATTQYQPQLAARGELLLRYDGGFVMQAQGQTVARALSYRGLDRFVACVPEAHQHARSAQSHGGAAIALSVIGVTLSLASLGSLAGLADTQHQWSWLGGGLAAGAVGLTLSALAWREKNQANGHALDAMNHYNDAVGSLGASCQDLRYPPAAGPAPQAPDAMPDSLPMPPAVSPSSGPN